MRLHSDKITYNDIMSALMAEQDAGRIARTVRFKVLDDHGSKSHARAFEVQLESTGRIPGDGRRVGNSGSYGAMGWDSGYAATHSEWGWLMAALYRVDPAAIWGSAKHPQYASSNDFHEKTGMTFAPGHLLARLVKGVDPYPYTLPRMVKGREGAGRFAEQTRAWGRDYLKYNPRNAAEYAKFAHVAAEVSA
jgi:hypothetical protein